jgi:orotate phosphoribosyltransferase
MISKSAVCEAIYDTKIITRKADGKPVVKEAFKAGYFILTSGKISPFYVDTRVIPASRKNYPIVLNELKYATKEIITEFNYDHNNTMLVSSESAGLAWGSPTAAALGLPWGFVRKEGFEFAGAVPAGSRALGVDDLATTLKTTKLMVDVTRAEGAKVEDALVLVDRQEYRKEDLEKLGIRLHNLVTVVPDLVNYGLDTGQLEKRLFDDIEAYRKDESEFAIRALQGQTEFLLKHARWGKVRPFYEKENNPKVLAVIDEILAKAHPPS